MDKRFGFLLFDEFEDLDFVGPWEMIGVWSKQFNGPKERIIISEKNNFVTSNKDLTVKTDVDFNHCPPLDFLLIPGGMGTRREVTNNNLIAFIQQQAQCCQQLLSVCTGAFLLQAAGLLTNKQATTHYASLDRLRKFPEINVVEKRYTHDGNIWTSAGISAGIDMTLAFIAALTDEATAGAVQLHSEYFPDKIIYNAENQVLPKYVINE